MDTNGVENGASKSTEADNTDPSNTTSANQSAVQSVNQRFSKGNPTKSLINLLASAELTAAHHTVHNSTPRSNVRKFSSKASIVSRTAMVAHVSAEIRVRFKLTDATFEQLPLAKTLAAVRILTKLANRAVKFAKQDTVVSDETQVSGKLLFSPFVVQANAPQKTQISPQLDHRQAYETVPELVNLSGVKQGGNLLLVLCHFYNAAVTRASMKEKISMTLSAFPAENGTSLDTSDTDLGREKSRLRKLTKRLYLYVDSQFPKLNKLLDLSTTSREDARVADLVNKDLFLYVISLIVKHDFIMEKEPSARIDLTLINEVILQTKREIEGTNKEGNAATARRPHLRNASLSAVISSFITSYVKMERNFFRECRVRARLILLDQICCLAVLVKYKIPGCSVEYGRHKNATSGSVPATVSEDGTPSSPDMPDTHSESDTEDQEKSAWFESLPKTKTPDRVKLAGFDDCILGADQGFPVPLPVFGGHPQKRCELPKTLRDENMQTFKKYQNEHPEFKLYFTFKKFVVSAPHTNDVMRTNDFETVPAVSYKVEVDVLIVARDYLVQLLGCTSWPQLLALHENAMTTVISFARSILALTRDYVDGPTDDCQDPETTDYKDKAHMQMFFVTTNSKLVRPVNVGNVAGMFGVKKELPPAPLFDSLSNSAFVGTLHEYFDSKSQKVIAGKICMGRKEYDNGVTDLAGAECVAVDAIESGSTAEEPSTKRIRFTFDDDSDADFSD